LQHQRGAAGRSWVVLLSLRRELRGLSQTTAAYVRLARLASWQGLPQEEHVTAYDNHGELGRNLPEQRQAVDRIVGAYVRRALSARRPA